MAGDADDTVACLFYDAGIPTREYKLTVNGSSAELWRGMRRAEIHSQIWVVGLWKYFKIMMFKTCIRFTEGGGIRRGDVDRSVTERGGVMITVDFIGRGAFRSNP